MDPMTSSLNTTHVRRNAGSLGSDIRNAGDPPSALSVSTESPSPRLFMVRRDVFTLEERFLRC